MSLYLIINILTIAAPLILSFDKKVHFHTYFKGVFLGIILMMLLFIPWDVYFTHLGIWGFNPEHLSGIHLFNLPIEEWLFFITVPFACVFIHEVLKAWFPQLNIFKNVYKRLFISLIIIQIAVCLIFTENYYTISAFGINALFLFFLLVNKVNWLPRFLLTYTVVIIPFLIVNGILTGGFTEEPVVWYNNDHNIGLRVFTIPIEDFMYNMLMLGIVIGVHEEFKKRFTKK